MTKISIIVPIYNVEKYLEKALDSIINQTLQDIEIICIDDCSTDSSLAILRKYAECDKRIKLFEHNKNKGVGAARNLGLDNASGEYIMFLDPDDWYEPEACEICYNQISKNQNDLVIFGHNRYIESSGEYQYNSRIMTQPFDKFLEIARIKLDSVETNFIQACYGWAVIYKKDFLNKYKIRYPKYNNFEDHSFYIDAMINADTISVIDKPLYNYRIRKTSATFVYKNQYNDILDAKKEIISKLNNLDRKNLKTAIYFHTINSVVHWFERYEKDFKHDKKLLYNNVKEIFKLSDTTYIEKEVKPRLSKYRYKKYKKILKQSWFVYKNKQILKNIFSVCNDNEHKVIKLLGFQIKYRRDIRLISLRFYSYLTAWMFPLKEDRKRYRSFCSEIDERKKILKAHKNYLKIIKRIRNKKGKIKVLFLVNDIAKWKTQTLFDLFSECQNFEPIVALTVADMMWRDTKEQKKFLMQEILEYFKSKKMNCIIAYDVEKDMPLKLETLKPDLIFYQHPWRLHKLQHPEHTSKFALPFYIPYHVDNYSVIPQYNKPFHKYLYRHIVLNKQWESEYKKSFCRKNIIGLGHTMLDFYYLSKDKKSRNNYVIYAPHWSFKHDKNRNAEYYGTFLKNRYEILEFAKNHPEINWVFKPHPRLMYALQDIGETEEQINSYWDEWRKIGIVCENSDYMDLFTDSKALITDCGSFLTEYFCTKKPLIHLISSDCRIEPNWIARKYFNTFYKVHNLDEMYETFEKVIIKGEDDKKDLRLQVLKQSDLLNNYAAKNILEDILNTVYGEAAEKQ